MHSAEGWEAVLLPEIERQQEREREVVFRADAAFAKPEIYETLGEGERGQPDSLSERKILELKINNLQTQPNL